MGEAEANMMRVSLLALALRVALVTCMPTTDDVVPEETTEVQESMKGCGPGHCNQCNGQGACNQHSQAGGCHWQYEWKPDEGSCVNFQGQGPSACWSKCNQCYNNFDCRSGGSGIQYSDGSGFCHWAGGRCQDVTSNY